MTNKDDNGTLNSKGKVLRDQAAGKPNVASGLVPMMPAIGAIHQLDGLKLQESSDNAAIGPVEREYGWFCPVSEEITDQSAEEARTGQYMLWPLVIKTQRDEQAGIELRGQLKGVFIVGDSGTAAVGDLVTFLGNNYMLFQFDSEYYNEGRFMAFGPV